MCVFVFQVGSFVFRIYDANDPVDTLATSHAWQVDAQGRDVELSLRFVLNQLRSTDGKGSVMGALAQLAHLLGHLQVWWARPERSGWCRLVGDGGSGWRLSPKAEIVTGEHGSSLALLLLLLSVVPGLHGSIDLT